MEKVSKNFHCANFLLMFLLITVCPANWNPDTNPDTIKPDPVNSKEYFNKQKN